MRSVALIGMCTLGLLGCDSILPYSSLPDGYALYAVQDGGTPLPPDLAMPPVGAKCAAAKNLTGDPLLCVDFNQIATIPDTQKLPGWDFFCSGGASWTSTGGALQVKDFATFKDECTAKMPSIDLTQADKQKYKTLTLSLVHRIDLNDPEQKAQIYLSTTDPTRLMYQATGKKDVSLQQTTITINKADLPAAVNNLPQWLLKLSSTAMIGTARTGWQVESIAVLGNP